MYKQITNHSLLKMNIFLKKKTGVMLLTVCTNALVLDVGPLYGFQITIHGLVLHATMQEISLSVSGDGWFNLYQ